jgi:hypothetical protein
MATKSCSGRSDADIVKYMFEYDLLQYCNIRANIYLYILDLSGYAVA